MVTCMMYTVNLKPASIVVCLTKCTVSLASLSYFRCVDETMNWFASFGNIMIFCCCFCYQKAISLSFHSNFLFKWYATDGKCHMPFALSLLLFRSSSNKIVIIICISYWLLFFLFFQFVLTAQSVPKSKYDCVRVLKTSIRLCWI